MSRTFRRRGARGATAIASVMALAWLASGAQALGAATGPQSQSAPASQDAVRSSAAAGAAASLAAAGSLPSPSGTGTSNVSDLGATGWRVQSSAAAAQTGAQISTPGFGTSGWLPVANDDAGAPGTEIEALAQNGRCPGDPSLQPVNQSTDSTHSVFYSANIRSCYGYMSSVGADTVAEFAVPWWWRTDFTTNLRPGQAAKLIINGVIGSADVWVNGRKVASASTVTGAYSRQSFDITGDVRPGENSLAIEVNPNNPQTMFTLDDVDWNQIPPDNNTGIQFPVQLSVQKALAVGNAHVVENNTADLSRSALTVKTDVTNDGATAQSGLVAATIRPPGGGAPIGVARSVTVPAHTTQTVTFTPSRYPALTITHPRVWWPYQLGAQPLYSLGTSVSQGGAVLSSTSEEFGIRNVTSYLTSGTSPGAPDGARGFKVNGVPIVIRGGGFSPNIFLHYSAADTAEQIALMKNMGVNMIRLEGHIMPADFFRQMDQAGHPDQRRLPVLRRLGAAIQRADQPGRLPGPAELGADDRREPAQPPQRVQLPVERPATAAQAGIGDAGRAGPGRLR